MATLVTLDATPAERAIIHSMVPDAVWPGEADLAAVRGVLSLWPRSEFRRIGITWQDIPSVDWLKVITAGVNHVGWQEVPPHVQVMSTPATTGAIIAEYVLGAVIAWARGFTAFTRDIRAGRFEVGRAVRALSELNVGIVGHGGLGQAIAADLQHHGASVRAVSRSGRSVNAPTQTMDHLPEMLAWADVLVLAVPLHKDTIGLIDAPQLDAIGDGLVVNVARGPVVDEDALYAWLRADPEHRAAHLDVWWHYPRRDGHPFHAAFHELPNVTMTPHNSPNVAGFRERMLRRACEDLEAIQRGEWRHVEDRDAHALTSTGDGRE